jgi:hypothetical protein
MPRYFFNLHELTAVILDDTGVERTTLDAVQFDAIRAARDVMCGDLRGGRLDLSSRIEVLDESGGIALSLPFRDAVEIVQGEDQP